MKIIEASHEILTPSDFIAEAKLIELAGRTAYKSEDKITSDSYDSFIRGIIKRGHEAVIEFGSMAVRFISDRGVSHELVRHRMCSFLQESTRYVCYANQKFGSELTVIRPSDHKYLEVTALRTRICYETWQQDLTSPNSPTNDLKIKETLRYVGATSPKEET